VALARARTIRTERTPLVGEVSANFCGQKGVAWSARRIPYGHNFGFLDRRKDESHIHFVITLLTYKLVYQLLYK
jgi:hypothetical protein